MKYSYNWLQKHIAEPLPSVQELEQKIIFHAFEVEEIETTQGDTVMEIKVLPDRAGDAFSHYGMAREISGLLGVALRPQETIERLFPEVTGELPLVIKTMLCNRYLAIKIEGVTVGESPEWLKNSLSSIGQKSINTVVDATNYVLNDLGQPTHAFDADKVVGPITVRMAEEGEMMVTLSDEEKILSATDVVIADDEGILAIAGVKGGKRAEVTSHTKNIILEIANFDAVSVRKTSRRLGLITDASKRFENTISPVLVPFAAVELARMVQNLATGHVIASHDQYQNKAVAREIIFTRADIARILGDTITEESIESVLTRYHYSYVKKDGAYYFSVPYYRADITGAHDMAEEIGRVVGYDTIATKTLPFVPVQEKNETDVKIQSIKKYLVHKGYCEVMNYSFRKKGDLYVSHAPKDKSALRTNLTDGIKESFEMNRLNAPLLGIREVKLFEVGTVFTNESESIHVALASKQGVDEYTLDEIINTYSVDTNDSSLLFAGEVFEAFRPWSSYPFIVRDVAVWLSEGDSAAQKSLHDVCVNFAREHTIMPTKLFDSFTKEGRTSYAYRFIFQSNDRTLTDDEVVRTLAPLLENIKTISGAELR